MDRPLVLLVDDDDDVRHMTRVSLGFEGFSVVEAADSLEGMAVAREQRPAAIVLDVMMPGIDGLDMLRSLRSDADLASIPVIILTARAGRTAETASWDAGATAFITKPFTGEALATTLRSCLPASFAETSVPL